MRILITGTTGQVGYALRKTLGHIGEIVAVGRSEMDLARLDQIDDTLDRLNPDLIINAAAYTAVDRAEDDRDMAFRINADSPAVIARWSAWHGAPLIHFSTDYVFDGTGTRPWREDDSPKPLSVYGASKLAGEEAARAAHGPLLIIRTSWVYAAEGRNFLLTIAKLAREREELRVVADQIGAPTSARLIADTVEAIIARGGRSIEKRFAASDALVNVAASGDTSWHGFALAIVDGLRMRGVELAVKHIIPIESKDYPAKAKRPGNSRLDLSRLQHVFGISTPRWDRILPAELASVAAALRSE